MNAIDYVINCARYKFFHIENEDERKLHVLACNEAEEDVRRFKLIEHAAIRLMFTKDAGISFEQAYRELVEAVGVLE